jgi:hypothetical protein
MWPMEGKASFHSGQARTDLLIRAERALARRTRPWGGLRSAAVLLIGLTAAAALALMPAELALYDENHVLWQIASYPPAGVIRNLMRDSHPPLYYLLAQGWLALGGFDHPWAFRVLSLFLGLPALPLAFQIGRRLGGPRLGLSALALLALNPWFLFLLILIRMYGLTATLGAWGVWIVLRLLDRSTPRRWAAWTLAQGLLLFTHYYGTLLIAALWLTLLRRRPRGWPQGLLASTPAAALFALWLRQAYAGSIEHTVQQLSRIPVRPGPVEVVWHYGATALMGPFVDGAFARAASLALALGLFLALLVRRPRLRRLSSGGGELAVWVGLPLLLGALMALRWPFFAARYFAMLTVPGAVALAAALHRLRLRAWIPMILILGLIGLSRFPIMAAQPLGLSGFDDLGPALAGLNRSDPILAQARWHIDAASPFYQHTEAYTEAYRLFYEWTDLKERTAIVERHPSFWFVGVTVYQDFWRSWLEDLQTTHLIDFAATYPHPIPEYGASLFHLVRKPQTAPWLPTTARWQNGLTLTAIALPDPRLTPGASLRVGLRLHTDHPIPDRWTLFLHLLDPNGRWLAGWDAEPNPPTPAWTPGTPITYWHGLRLPMNLPAGRYTLALGWYPTGSTGTPRLPLQHPQGDALPIATVDILPLPRPPRWGTRYAPALQLEPPRLLVRPQADQPETTHLWTILNWQPLPGPVDPAALQVTLTLPNGQTLPLARQMPVPPGPLAGPGWIRDVWHLALQTPPPGLAWLEVRYGPHRLARHPVWLLPPHTRWNYDWLFLNRTP